MREEKRRRWVRESTPMKHISSRSSSLFPFLQIALVFCSPSIFLLYGHPFSSQTDTHTHTLSLYLSIYLSIYLFSLLLSLSLSLSLSHTHTPILLCAYSLSSLTLHARRGFIKEIDPTTRQFSAGLLPIHQRKAPGKKKMEAKVIVREPLLYPPMF